MFEILGLKSSKISVYFIIFKAEHQTNRKKLLNGSDALVTSNKGSIGHLLGAAGALESIFSVLSVYEGIVPPSINIDHLDPQIEKLGLNIVRSKVCDTTTKRRTLLKNSFGFGGTNASLVLESYD